MKTPMSGRLSGWVGAAGVAAWGLVFGVSPARATLALALELPQLTRLSDRVVLAEVLSVSSAWTASRDTIVSTIDLTVRETWKGPLSPDGRLSLVQVGGQVGEVVVRVPGQAQFTVGERAVLFLRGEPGSEHLVGLGQGKWPLRFDARTSAWIADPGDRSVAVQVGRDGQMRPAKGTRSMGLATLRKKVRALARR
jgi:hypothetical protein